MALPVRDILAVEKSKATRFGHYGLIVIIRGHEELFFEFGAKDRRDAFVSLLERQMEGVRKRQANQAEAETDAAKRAGLILEELGRRTIGDEGDLSGTVPEHMTDSLPAVMFTSASSTFLTFKPSDSLHFTFLTIGSRGDVQPYIALAKGLMADGHRCRIATHGEFQAWIESVGGFFFVKKHCLLSTFSMGLNSGTLAAIQQNSCEYVLRTAHSRSLS